MKITEETAQAYLKMATGCPACGEKGNAEGGPVEIEGESAYQQLSCTECLAEWSDAYDLDRVIVPNDDDCETFSKPLSEPYESAPDLLAALIDVYDNAKADSPDMWGRVRDAIDKASRK